MARRNHKEKLELKGISGAIDAVIQPENISKTVQEVTGARTFEDALQSIETISRPSTLEDITNVSQSLLSTVILAGEDVQNWKLLLLTVVRKRYHMKSPEAKSIKKKGEDDEEHDQTTSGHGERMSFYVLFFCLHYLSRLPTSIDKEEVPAFIPEYSAKSCRCLGRLTIAAGGTRDICFLIEHLMYDDLVRSKVIEIQNSEGKKRAISAAVIKFLNSSKDESTILGNLVKATAEMLDKDFSIIKGRENNPDMRNDMELQSTINTFLPHHNRGKNRNERRLVQSISEFLIWSETEHSQSDPKFVKAVADMKNCTLSLPLSDPSSDDNIVSSLHVVQTSVRRFRQKLNKSSRDQGFALCSSYSMDPKAITLSMVKRGREGDVMTLQKLAKRKLDNNTMQLISNRFSDPSKAVAIQSFRDLCTNWIALDDKSHDDEMKQLQLDIQKASVKATIKLLTSKLPKTSSGKKVVVASLDGKVENDCAAILVAVAFDSKLQLDDEQSEGKIDDNGCDVTLFIKEKRVDVSTITEVLSLLDGIICTKRSSESGGAGDAPAATKDVQNLIERHLGPNSHLLLFASNDIKIEQRVLTNLQLEKSHVHCHLIDDFHYRMQREKAKVGDITITLAWDNECDLDLHCICPNGDRISYSKKEGGGSIGGGYLDVDMNVNGESKEPVENIFFGDAEAGIEASKGKYKVIVQNYAYHGKTVKRGDPVKWRLRRIMNGKIEDFSGQCVGSGSGSDVTAVEFEYEGRKAPKPEDVGSALTSSNLVSVTSSNGDSLDSVSGLMSIVNDAETLTNVQNLIGTEDSQSQELLERNDNTNDDASNVNRPLMAATKSFDITSRDRLYLGLSKLPKLFHLEVNACFGESSTLFDHTAVALAKRLIADEIPLNELKKAGYNDEIVSIVEEKMRTLGVV